MFYRLNENGALLFIRLTPKASKDVFSSIEEFSDGKTYLNVRIRAVPEDGKANKALLKFLAKALKYPASRFSLEAGATSRIKQVQFGGDEAEAIELIDKIKQQLEINTL